ncbi:MAG: hypothetical protein GXY48_10435 [Methanomicrobiales archaeon]|nr:hypothetical protein [Methanomicrobiales archaeon]
MTEVYERDLYGMKFAILKSPYHKKVVKTCAEILGIAPMRVRKIFIENLDMLMLESLGARYDSWMEHGDPDGGIRREIGYDLFTRYIPIISQDIMNKALEKIDKNGETAETAREYLRNRVFPEDEE